MKKLPATDNKKTSINSTDAMAGEIFFGIMNEIRASPTVIRITISTTFSIDAPTIKSAVFNFLFMFL